MIADQLKHLEPRDSVAFKGRCAPESTNKPKNRTVRVGKLGSGLHSFLLMLCGEKLHRTLMIAAAAFEGMFCKVKVTDAQHDWGPTVVFVPLTECKSTAVINWITSPCV